MIPRAVANSLPWLAHRREIPHAMPSVTLQMPRLSLLACNAECHHANAEAEPPGMSGGQGKDATKGEKDWR